MDEILSLPSLVGFSVESTSNLTGDKITQTQFVCLLKLKTKTTTLSNSFQISQTSNIFGQNWDEPTDLDKNPKSEKNKFNPTLLSWVDKEFLQGLSSEAWQGHIVPTIKVCTIYILCTYA